MPDGQGTELYELLRDLRVPFIICTEFEVPEAIRNSGVVVAKPTRAEDLVSVAEELVRRTSCCDPTQM